MNGLKRLYNFITTDLTANCLRLNEIIKIFCWNRFFFVYRLLVSICKEPLICNFLDKNGTEKEINLICNSIFL